MPIQSEADAQGRVRSTGSLFDAVVIGSGFGGAVAACRLTQPGRTFASWSAAAATDRGDFPRLATRPDHLPHTAPWAWALDCGLSCGIRQRRESPQGAPECSCATECRPRDRDLRSP